LGSPTAKARAQAIVCLNNTRQLVLAWQVYEADEAPAGVARDPTGTPPREPAIAGEPVACLPCLTWTYPHSAATREPAKTSVSALRRRGAAEDGDEARLWFRPAAWPAGSGGLSATERGTAHHRFLQLVRLDQVGSRAGLAAEPGSDPRLDACDRIVGLDRAMPISGGRRVPWAAS